VNTIFKKGTKMIDFTLKRNKPSYYDDLEVAYLNLRLKDLYKIYKTKPFGIVGHIEILDLNPIYQRDLVWAQPQKANYILNLFYQKAFIEPTIIEYYNEKFKIYEILDGKQRLTTLFDFIDNKFPVFVAGFKIYFSDLQVSDKAFLLNHDVRYKRIMHKDLSCEIPFETKLELFLEVNELGTKLEQDDINKVKTMLYNEKFKL